MAKTKVVTFLDNPPRGARRARKGRKHASNPPRKRRTPRNPPRGYPTWAAYMASIRPGAKRRRKRAHNPTGATMAKQRKSHARRRNAPAVGRVNAPRKHRRYHRRKNPPLFGKLMRHGQGTGPVAFAVRTAGRAIVGVGGEVVVRKIRGSLFKQAPGTIVGSALEAVLGLVGGFALSLVHPGAGAAFAQGAVSAPLRTEIQQLAIPHISDSLGDDGYVMGPGTGVTLISAYPADYAGVVQGEEAPALGRYVSGAGPGDTVQGYVAGAINNAA